MEVRCVLRANYLAPGMSHHNFGQFEVWLPSDEATRLLNDSEARCRLFRMHYPTCVSIDRNMVSIELHEWR